MLSCPDEYFAILFLRLVFKGLRHFRGSTTSGTPFCFSNQEKKNHIMRKSMPSHMLCGATTIAARFGSFEILTRKVQAANNGIPLAIYQEACCGLISGAVGTVIWNPFLASAPFLRAAEASESFEPINCRKLFNTVYLKARNDGILASWKGSGPYATYQMCMAMGFLTSYSRSISYFRDSISMSPAEAQVSNPRYQYISLVFA